MGAISTVITADMAHKLEEYDKKLKEAVEQFNIRQDALIEEAARLDLEADQYPQFQFEAIQEISDHTLEVVGNTERVLGEALVTAQNQSRLVEVSSQDADSEGGFGLFDSPLGRERLNTDTRGDVLENEILVNPQNTCLITTHQLQQALETATILYLLLPQRLP